MSDGITRKMETQQAWRIMSAAKDKAQEGESPLVTATRTVIRDHERDPSDGTIRMFGGRDESRVVSSISRIDPQSKSSVEVEGRLKADVAIQRMGAKRERDLIGGVTKGMSSFEKRDIDAVRGDSGGIGMERSRFTAGNLGAGDFEKAAPDMRKWVQDTVASAGRESEGRSRGGIGDRMASIGAFSPSRARTAEPSREEGRPVSKLMAQASLGKTRAILHGRGPQASEGPDVATQARFLSDGIKTR
jgi:hypothetical protein